MVGMLTFHSDDPSSNPAEAHYFSEKFVFEKKENKQKEARVGPFLKKTILSYVSYFIKYRITKCIFLNGNCARFVECGFQ